MAAGIWKRFHAGMPYMTRATHDVYDALWCEARKRKTTKITIARAALAAASGHDARTTRTATSLLEEMDMLVVERHKLTPDRNAINHYHLRHVWIHWFRWEPSKKTLHKRATDLGDPPHPSKREKSSKKPAQKCNEETASKIWKEGSLQWYYCQGLTPPWEDEDRKKVITEERDARGGTYR